MSASKKKGTGWESAIVSYLVERGWPHCERRTLQGVSDKGDVAGIPGVMIEAKNEKTVALGSYLNEVERETVNARAEVGVAWVHRRGKASPADGYVIMNGDTFVRLLKLAGW